MPIILAPADYGRWLSDEPDPPISAGVGGSGGVRKWEGQGLGNRFGGCPDWGIPPGKKGRPIFIDRPFLV